MKIIIDSNRAIAALIKDSTTRKILLDSFFEFFAPEHIQNEIKKYREDIIQKTDITQEELEILLSLIFEYITIVPQTEYNQLVEELKTEIKDPDDVPYLAVYLLINAEGLWTHDPHFQVEKKFKIFTNIDMLRLSGKAKAP